MNGARVLVVDDEPMVVEVVERYLSREGFAVSTAADGEHALAAFHEVGPHLVVLDLMLPKIGGMEVCREIRRFSAVPIIMLTARGDEIDRIAGFEVGAGHRWDDPRFDRGVTINWHAPKRLRGVQP